MMAASSGGAMFIKSIDANDNIQDEDYVASLFLQLINQIRDANIVQIITYNRKNFKLARLHIESRYPHIFWTPYVVHSLNLALKNICDPFEISHQYTQCKWIANLVSDMQTICNFIVNHSMALSIYKKYSKLSLLRIVDTRFASSIVMSRRLKEMKTSLEKMVMDFEWKSYKDANVVSKSHEVKQCIVNDQWSDRLDYFLSFTEPILNMLQVASTDTLVLHLIYDMWDSMIERVKKFIFDHKGKDLFDGSLVFFIFCFYAIHEILESRWNKSNTHVHCMTHSLVPKYYCDAWLQGGNNEIMRIAPHEDQEVSTNRSKCFKRLFQNPNDLRKVYT
nr:uncharacterized protein LOC125419190 [Ziziphus jujuba var. spinosa]